MAPCSSSVFIQVSRNLRSKYRFEKTDKLKPEVGAQTCTTSRLDGVNNIFVFMSIPNNQFFISLKSLFDKVLPFLINSSNNLFGLYLYCTANCSWKHNANQKRQNIAETCLDQRLCHCCFIRKESHPVSPPIAHFAENL